MASVVLPTSVPGRPGQSFSGPGGWSGLSVRFQQSSVSSHVHFGTLWKQFTRFKNPPSWQHVEKIGKDKRLSEYDAATTQSDPMPLYKWGAVEWTVWPFNTNEVDHTVETDWAHKE